MCAAPWAMASCLVWTTPVTEQAIFHRLPTSKSFFPQLIAILKMADTLNILRHVYLHSHT